MSLPDWLHAPRDELRRRLEADSLPHALLLLGRAGLGKRALARWLCQRALCQQPEGGDGCGNCRGCELFAAGTHPDFFACVPAEGKQQIGVDQIRELNAKVTLTRTQSEYQVFLMEQAERMNANAANAFLKSLEEPTPGTLLILLAERRDALPATVTSRCQIITLHTPPAEQAIAWLRLRGGSPGDEELRQALAAAGGAPGVAQELIDAGIHGGRMAVGRSLAAIAAGRQDVAVTAAAWADQHLDHRLRWMASLLHALIWQRLRGSESLEPEFKALAGLTQRADPATLFACYRRANACRRLLSGSLRPELLVEDLLLGWQSAAGAPR